MTNQNYLLTPPITTLAAPGSDLVWPDHRDVTPAPQPIRNGQVVSVCSCGQKFVGVDPDHAEWQLFDHIDNAD